jgi:hypothetical protein
MASPTYQTERDVESEEDTIACLRKSWGLNIERMPDFHEFDYAVVDSKQSVRGLIEIKNRKADASKYPTIILSMSKVIAAKQWSDQGIKCFLVVRVGKGKPRFLEINKTKPSSIQFGGRKGRNHQEPLAHFDKSDFLFI